MPVSELDSLSGLESAKRLVRLLARDQHCAHAVLIYGAQGSGKSTVAREFAAAWLCTSLGESGACGVCKPCQSRLRGSVVDLLLIAPTGASRWVKREAINGSDLEGGLSIQHFVRTGPLSAAHKVVVLEDADRLTGDAANALLKLLEEPPEYVRFALTTRQVGAVIPTLLSRCLAVRCDSGKSQGVSVFGDTPGRAKEHAARLAYFERVEALAKRIQTAEYGEALVIAEALRALVDETEGARQGLAAAIEHLGQALGNRNPAFGEAIAEAHRFVVGNASGALVTDNLVLKLVRERIRTSLP